MPHSNATDRLTQATAHFSRCISREYKGHKSKVHSVAWNCAGNFLASGSVDKTARLWTPDRGTNSLELRGHTDSVDQLVWSPTHSSHLATASSDRTVRIWDARTPPHSQHTIPTSGENINITWSPDSIYIAVGNKDDTIEFIDTRTWKIVDKKKYDFEVNEIGWCHGGGMFFVTTSGGEVKILEWPGGKEVHTLEAHTSSCYCVEVDPVARYLAVGSADALVSLWDVGEWVCVRTFGKLDFPVRTISFSFDGDYLASGSEDLAIDISHVESGESVFSIKTTAAINTLAWHPNRYLLAYAGDEPRADGGFVGNLRVFGFHK